MSARGRAAAMLVPSHDETVGLGLTVLASVPASIDASARWPGASLRASFAAMSASASAALPSTGRVGLDPTVLSSEVRASVDVVDEPSALASSEGVVSAGPASLEPGVDEQPQTHT